MALKISYQRCSISEARIKITMIKLMVLISLFQGLSASCPAGFELYDDSCYKAFAMVTSWTEAKEYCKIVGGDLAMIESPEEETIVEELLKKFHGKIPSPLEHYWVDGSDILEEGTWRWMRDGGNSIPITGYTNWHSRQPDNKNNEDCMELMYDWHLQWNDEPCDNKFGFICEASVQSDGTDIIG